MKIIIFLIITGFCLFSFSCNPDVSSDEGCNVNIVVDVAQERTTVNYNNLSDSLFLIPLETTDNSLLADITKLCIDDSIIIIFDHRTQLIHRFGLDGKHLGSIGVKGRGANEYMYFNDIHIDKDRNIIYAFDRHLQKMFCYNYAGDLLKQIPSAINFNSFVKVGSDFWVYSCFTTSKGERYNLMKLDSTLQEVKQKYFPQQNDFIGVTFDCNFSEDNSGVLYFSYPMSDGIYRIGKDSLELAYYFDFGSRRKPYEQLQQIDDHFEYDKFVTETSYLGSLSDVRFHNDNLFVRFKESPIGIPIDVFSYCYNIKSDHGGLISVQGDSPLFCMNVLGSYDDFIISELQVDLLFEEGLEQLEKEYEIKGVSNNNNSILAFFRLKKAIF